MSGSKSGAGQRFVMRGLLLGVTPVLVVAGIAYHYAMGGRFVTTENAYVRAEIVTLSTNVDGQVTDVLVRDNQKVEEGDPLFLLDARPFEMELAATEAELANVKHRLASLRADYQRGRMEIAAAEERIRYLTVEQARQRQLLDKGVGTQSRFDAAEHELLMATRHLGVVREANRMVLADLGGSLELPLEAHPLFLRAEAARARAELNHSYSVVYAPETGTLSNVTLERGEYVEAGDPLFALVSTEEPWIEVNLKEVHLTHVRVGQKATVVVDSYPDVVWNAVVESISPATGAEFAILPPQNATGNWVKVVQRVPVRLALEDRQHLHLLRSGMTATVSIDTGYERDVAKLIKSVLAEPFESHE